MYIKSGTEILKCWRNESMPISSKPKAQNDENHCSIQLGLSVCHNKFPTNSAILSLADSNSKTSDLEMPKLLKLFGRMIFQARKVMHEYIQTPQGWSILQQFQYNNLGLEGLHQVESRR